MGARMKVDSRRRIHNRARSEGSSGRGPGSRTSRRRSRRDKRRSQLRLLYLRFLLSSSVSAAVTPIEL